MSEHDTPEYLTGAGSPISAVTHLFSTRELRKRDGEVPPKPQSPANPVPSLCGAVKSYGPFRPASEGDEDEVCKNCERVRRRREQVTEDD